MSTYSQIAWLPLCGGLTGLGLVGSYLVYRKRGFAAGLRGVGWSLIPMAAYLTQSVQTLWDMGAKLVDFATGFVFSPERWAGIVLVGVAAVAFVVSGLLLRRGRPAKVDGGKDRPVKSGSGGEGAAKTTPGLAGTAPKPALSQRSGRRAAAASDDDDDFSEVEKILRDRGIS